VHEGAQQLPEAATSTRARNSVKFCQLFACVRSSSWLVLSSEPSPTFSSHVKQPQILYLYNCILILKQELKHIAVWQLVHMKCWSQFNSLRRNGCIMEACHTVT